MNRNGDIYESGIESFVSGLFNTMIQHVNIPPGGIRREDIHELGRRAPYHRFVTFPLELSGVKNEEESNG